MRALIVHAHPDPASFSAHLAAVVVDGLTAGGHEHRTIDLYAEGFEAALSEAEWRLHRSTADHKPWTTDHARLLAWADTIVWVYPTWWSGPPAIMKGWVDRVWTNGIAYHHTDAGLVPGPLVHVRRMYVVTTHGSSRFVNMLEGDVGKKMVRRTLRTLCGLRCRTRWLAMYDLDRSTAAGRERFAAAVQAVFSQR